MRAIRVEVQYVFGALVGRLFNCFTSDTFQRISTEFGITDALFTYVLFRWGTAVAQWLRCCATNRKVAGSIPNGVTGIFH